MNLQQYSISENNFEQCVKCTICTVYCPVVAVNPDYPGPKQAGPDGERFRLKDPASYDPALKYCLNCKRCEVACPSGVRIGDIIQSARMKHNRSLPKVRDVMLANTDVVGSVATRLSGITNAVLRAKPVKRTMDAVLHIDHRRCFPAYAGQTFRQWYKTVEAAQRGYKNHVSYFHGCYVNYNHPQLGKDLVRVLNAVGYGVHLLQHEQCCGVALISNGLTAQARRHARHNLKAVRQSVAERGMPVVTTSSTCTFTMRDEYPHLLKLDNADVRDSIELGTRFLYKLLDAGRVRLAFKDDFSMRAAYHAPCHMEKLGWQIYSLSLLRMIPGLQLTVLGSNCCGIAGTYGFKRENYDTSQQIGEPLFRQIADVAPQYVLTDCETCKWQIEMSAHVLVLHPVTVLAMALDVEETARLNVVK